MNNDILTSNLAALEIWNAHAARALRDAEIPPHWHLAPAADGSQNFQRLTPDRLVWLGGNSLPVASASAMTASMTPGNTNAMGLSLGTGHAWLHLLTRLARHQTLFILEPDPVAARLALTLCDLAAPLSTGKLLLLLGDPQEIRSQLLALIAQHPGLEPPVVMHPLPALTGETRNALLATGEAAIREAIAARAQSMETAAAQLTKLSPGKAPIILSRTPRHRWENPIPHLPATPALRLDDPLHGGRLARMNLCLMHPPEVIITDLWRGELEIPLPENIPIETWVSPMPGLAFWQPERLALARRLGRLDRVVVRGVAHQEWLIRAGLPREKIRVIPPRWNSNIPFNKLNDIAPTIVMSGDLPSIDPAGYGITLPSHVALWQAAREMIAEDPLAFHWDMTPDLFRRAQQRTGVAVDDPALAESLLRGLRLVLMESVIPLTIARLLHDAGIPLLLAGDGWEQAGLTDNVRQIPFPLCEQSFPWPPGIFLQVGASGVVSPALLEAAAAGLAIAAINHPLDTRPGGICEILEADTQMTRIARLGWLGQVRQLLGDPARRVRTGGAASERMSGGMQ